MHSTLCDFFEKEKIEYFGVIPIEECIVQKKHLLEKIDSFSPKSVICYAVPYYTGAGKNLSCYALSRDYHIFMKEIGQKLCDTLVSQGVAHFAVPFSDHSPFDEVSLAAKAGLGVRGENRLLLTEKYSSFVFIGEVVTDVDAETLGYVKAEEIRACQKCNKCKTACPSGCLLDAKCECLSSISQKKGELSPNEKALLIKENTAWGCDVCQLCCPHTQRAIQKNTLFTPIDYFYQNKIDRLSCRQIDEMDEKEFQMRAYSWRKRETIKRNLFILESADEKNSQSAYKGE